ncbi:MAG TPA: hypothetical protein VD864_13830 [Nocardioides sp.]|nr:hypothetical protein [Nocardioides sp.]
MRDLPLALDRNGRPRNRRPLRGNRLEEIAEDAPPAAARAVGVDVDGATAARRDRPPKTYRVVGPDGKAVPAAALERQRAKIQAVVDADDLTEWPMVKAVWRCHGEELVRMTPENADGVFRVWCGRCNAPITELFEADDDEVPDTVTRAP